MPYASLEAYPGSNCSIVLLAIVQVRGLPVRASLVDSDDIVRSRCDELLAVGRVSKKGGARGICTACLAIRI